jgi:hypothetical protein
MLDVMVCIDECPTYKSTYVMNGKKECLLQCYDGSYQDF